MAQTSARSQNVIVLIAGTRICFLLSLWLMLPVFFGEASPQDWTVEGILYSENNPDSSAAVIDGNPLTRGQVYGEYVIARINPDSILVYHIATREESTLEVSGKKPPKDVKTEPPAESEAEKQKPPKPKFDLLPVPEYLRPLLSWWQSVQDWFTAQWATVKILMEEIERARERPLFGVIQQIRIASMQYYSETAGGMTGLSVKKLVESRYLPKSLADGKLLNYHFAVKPTPDGMQIIANPLNPSDQSRHYLFDDDGTLYYEEGKPATRQSAVYKGIL